MSLIPPPFDWSKRLAYDWTTQEGLNKLGETVRPSLPFDPTHFQLYCSACILVGKVVFCVPANGDGKSALIYIPILA